jgi:ceramide synthetase
MVVVWAISKVIQGGLHRFALYLNENVFTSGVNARVFDDKRRLMKFCDQGWQLVLHIMASLIELPSLLSEGLLTDVGRCWIPCPIDQTVTPAIQFAYMFELAAYTFHGFQHRFFQVKRRDYFVMFAHHITTCALVAGSYVMSCYRVGLIVMFIHDSSDILVDITQFLNHAHMEGPQFHFVLEAFFMSAVAGWFFTRLYYLPFKVLKSILFDCHSRCASKFPGQPWKYPICEGAPAFTWSVILLSVLIVMHIWWFYLFLVILVKVVKNEEDNKGDVYEHNHPIEDTKER